MCIRSSDIEEDRKWTSGDVSGFCLSAIESHKVSLAEFSSEVKTRRGSIHAALAESGSWHPVGTYGFSFSSYRQGAVASLALLAC